MNIKALKEYIEDIPDDYEVELSKYFLFEEEEDKAVGVLDAPVMGITKSDEEKCVRFMLHNSELLDVMGIIEPIDKL